MLIVDFSNAFNMVDRSALLQEVRVRCPSISLWVEFLYGQAARLYLGMDILWRPLECNKVTRWDHSFLLLCYTLSFIRSETTATFFFMLGILMMGLS
jgi:hypothetical protein